mgnify:CR=1 FL=1
MSILNQYHQLRGITLIMEILTQKLKETSSWENLWIKIKYFKRSKKFLKSILIKSKVSFKAQKIWYFFVYFGVLIYPSLNNNIVKDSRSSYLTYIYEKYNKYKKTNFENTQNQTFDQIATNKSSLMSSSYKNHKVSHVNIKSNSVLRERNKSEATLCKQRSLPGMTSNASTSPVTRVSKKK